MLLRKRAVQSAVQIENKNDIRRHNQAISTHIKQHLTLFDILKSLKSAEKDKRIQKRCSDSFLVLSSCDFKFLCNLCDVRLTNGFERPSNANLSNLEYHWLGYQSAGSPSCGWQAHAGPEHLHWAEFTLTCLTQANSIAVPNCVKNMNIIEKMN